MAAGGVLVHGSRWCTGAWQQVVYWCMAAGGVALFGSILVPCSTFAHL